MLAVKKHDDPHVAGVHYWIQSGAAQQGFEPGGASSASPCWGLSCMRRLIAARFHFSAWHPAALSRKAPRVKPRVVEVVEKSADPLECRI